MATKTFKIGLSATDKQNMAQDIYEQVEELLFEEYDSTKTYNENDYVVYSGVLYRALADNITGTWDNTKWQTATLNDLVDDVNSAVASVNGKANIIDLENGTLVPEKSSVAKNLEPVSSASGSTQTAPFINQGTATNNNDSQSEVDTGTLGQHLEKQGNTLVVNQQCKVITSSTSSFSNATGTISDGVATFTATAQYGGLFASYTEKFNVVNGHKYIVSFMAKATTSNYSVNARLNDTADVYGSKDITLGTSYQQYNMIIDYSGEYALTGNYGSIQIRDNNASGWSSVSCKDFHFIDLTQMFGSNDLIPPDLLANPSHFSWYYNGSLAYNTGELVNSNGRYIVNGGQNVWDEEWEVGSINSTTGQNEANTTLIRSKNYTNVIPNRDYYVYIGSANNYQGCYVYFYDINKSYIGIKYSANYSPYSRIITTPSDCAFIRFRIDSFYGTTYANDITISLYYEGEDYSQYIPYEQPKVYDTGSEVLRSAGSVKDYKEPNGTIHRLVGVVDLGSLTWTYSEQNGGFWYSTQISSLVKHNFDATTKPNCQCSSFEVINNQTMLASPYPNGITIYRDNGNIICRNGSSSTEPTGTLYYELATPTTEQGTAFTENMDINDMGNMAWYSAYTDETTNTLVGVPQGCKIFYPAWYAGFIDTLGQREDIGWSADKIVSEDELSAKFETYLKSLSGYDATATQVLKNVEGTLTWVSEE